MHTASAQLSSSVVRLGIGNIC